MDPILDQVTASTVIIMLIQWLKNSSWFPWLKDTTDKLNRLVAYFLAAIAAVGVHIEYDHAAGTALITGLTFTGILHGTWHWLSSIVVQELIYKGVLKPTPKVITT